MKNTLDGINNRLDETESNQQFGRQGVKNTQSDQKKEIIIINKNSLRDLQIEIKHNNVCITGVLGAGKRQQEIDNLFEEIMTENFLNLVMQIDM